MLRVKLFAQYYQANNFLLSLTKNVNVGTKEVYDFYSYVTNNPDNFLHTVII